MGAPYYGAEPSRFADSGEFGYGASAAVAIFANSGAATWPP